MSSKTKVTWSRYTKTAKAAYINYHYADRNSKIYFRITRSDPKQQIVAKFSLISQVIKMF